MSMRIWMMSKIGSKPKTPPRDTKNECAGRVDSGNDNWVPGNVQAGEHNRTLKDGSEQPSDNGRSATANLHVSCGDALERYSLRASAEMFIDARSQDYEWSERGDAARNDETLFTLSGTYAEDGASFRMHRGLTVGAIRTGDNGLDHVQEGFHKMVDHGRIDKRLTHNYEAARDATYFVLGASVGLSLGFETRRGELRLGFGFEANSALGYRGEAGVIANMRFQSRAGSTAYADIKGMYSTGDDIAGRDTGLNFSAAAGFEKRITKNFGLYAELRRGMNNQREALVGIRIGGARRPDAFEPGFD